jgi:lipopolysaccharide transport system ATP-binding protein
MAGEESRGVTAPIGVGMAGTFDVENYGDLLFPLIAQAALARRDPRLKVRPFSVNSRDAASWPFAVRATDELPEAMSSLSALLVGGGQIVRFDKGYPVPVAPHVAVPIDYWLVPAVLAATAGRPVIWNAVGAWTESPEAPWFEPVVRAVFSASRFIGVRDVASRDHLARMAPEADIRLLPDTAFSLSRLWPLEQESANYVGWRRTLGIRKPHVVVQADSEMAGYQPLLESVLSSMPGTVAVVVPICWCHGDRAESFPAPSGGMVRSPAWLGPRLLAEVLGRAELVVASSLHACITGLSYGVPVARTLAGNAGDRKFELLSGFEGAARLDDASALARVLARGRGIESRARDHADRLERYWDQVAEIAVRPCARLDDGALATRLSRMKRACAEVERLEAVPEPAVLEEIRAGCS